MGYHVEGIGTVNPDFREVEDLACELYEEAEHPARPPQRPWERLTEAEKRPRRTVARYLLAKFVLCPLDGRPRGYRG